MTYQVTVASGKRDVVLPNGSRYQAGDVVVLSDDEFSELTATALRTLFSAVSELGANVSHGIVLKAGASNVVLPNGQRYNGGASVTLSDAQYSTIPASARSALFGSDTANGISAVPATLACQASFPRLTPPAEGGPLLGSVTFPARTVDSITPATLAKSATFPAAALHAGETVAALTLAVSSLFPPPTIQH